MREQELERIVMATTLMRDLQRTYFTNRTRDNLNAAKRAEQIVDRLIAAYHAGQQLPEQATLLGGDA